MPSIYIYISMSVSVTATSSPRKPFFLFSVFPRSRHRIASFEFWSHYIWQPPIVSYSSHCRWNENCREEGEEVCHDSRTRLLVWLGWCLLLSTHCFPTWDEEQEGAGGGEKFLCHQKPENSPICTAVHVYIYSLLLSLCLSLSLLPFARGRLWVIIIFFNPPLFDGSFKERVAANSPLLGPSPTEVSISSSLYFSPILALRRWCKTFRKLSVSLIRSELWLS